MPELSAAAVLLVDVESSLAALLTEWLAEAGLGACSLPSGPSAASGPSGPPGPSGRTDPPPAPQLLVVDIPYPRQGGSARLQALAARWPGVPVLALSPTFVGRVDARGDVARQLGVAGVLATPVRREAWLDAVQQLLGATS